MEKELAELTRRGCVPRLLLHCCCAPCSSYVIELLSQYFEITLYYYNPNISPQDEYTKRSEELIRFAQAVPVRHPLTVKVAPYRPEEFYDIARPYAKEPEGGKRCELCFRLRLEETARLAKEEGFGYFTTTLSISPLKDAKKLNAIGEQLSAEYEISYLFSDFKKKGGYLRSIALSKEYDLYRQNFCGCVYSMEESRARSKEAATSPATRLPEPACSK